MTAPLPAEYRILRHQHALADIVDLKAMRAAVLRGDTETRKKHFQAIKDREAERDAYLASHAEPSQDSEADTPPAA